MREISVVLQKIVKVVALHSQDYTIIHVPRYNNMFVVPEAAFYCRTGVPQRHLMESIMDGEGYYKYILMGIMCCKMIFPSTARLFRGHVSRCPDKTLYSQYIDRCFI